ncbi:MAG TPA: ABC transporter substrate-binding protein, partial [Bacillota bacterium]
MTALLAGQVDAWAGLDPHMAKAELDAGAQLIFRRPEWNTFGFLNVLESFAQEHPDVVERVLAQYERGRQWVLANPDETVRILSEVSGVSVPVAERVLEERSAFPDPVPGEEHAEVLRGIVPILKKEELVPADADLEAAIEALIEPAFAERVLAEAGS